MEEKNKLVITRVLNAPRELVFKAWTDAEEMKRWWGPHGFTTPVCELDVRPDGLLKICMDSPEFPGHWVHGIFREVVKPERLVFVSTGFADESGRPKLEVLNTITFEELSAKTKLTVQVTLISAAPDIQFAVDGMDDGWSQSLDRLDDSMAGFATRDRELVLSRLLSAPRELVFKVWTKPEHIAKWWGPNGFTNTIHQMDVRPEGEWNLVMHGPDGTDYKNKNIFREIVKPERIVYEHVSGPKFLATITFKKIGDKTLLRWSMLFESKELFEQTVRTFKADQGLKQNVEKLVHYLELYTEAITLNK